MKKKLLIIIPILVLIIIILIVVLKKDDYSGNYQIKVIVFDEKTPDRKLVVLRNEKETDEYKYIKYKDDKKIILCYQKNPTVNKFDIEDELIIVLPNDKEVVAKVIKEEE